MASRRAARRGWHHRASVVCATTLLVVVTVAQAAEPGPLESDGDESTERVVAIAPDVPVTRHYVNPATGEHRALVGGLPAEDLVYSNTPPPNVYLALGLPDIRIADDIRTVAVGGCGVSAYEIMVAGGGDGTGPGFTVTFDLFDRCPHGGGVVIPGAGGSLVVDDDGLHVIVVDLSTTPIDIGQTFWLGVTVDSAWAGWVVGTPADMGYTGNFYDFMFNQCGRFGFHVPDPYAGFHARVWCEPPFTREFIAYFNPDLRGMPWSSGADEWLMDDVELLVDDCVLSSYEIGAVGTGNENVTVTAEMRSECEPGTVIAGTQGTSTFFADGGPRLARFEFPGGVDLGAGASFWMAYKFDRNAQAIVAGYPQIGSTDDLFGLLNDDQTCDIFSFGGIPFAGFAINVHCLGTAPMGACCELSNDGPFTCTQTPLLPCVYSGGRWAQGSTCDDPTAFDPPCGTAACCVPPTESDDEGCFDLTRQECEAIEDAEGHAAVWQPGQFCGVSAQHCVLWTCRFRDGACDVPHAGIGCNSAYCCDTVCRQDDFCCYIEWDSACVDLALGRTGCYESSSSYDRCWDPDPDKGAVSLNTCSHSDRPCQADSDCWSGGTCDATGVRTLRRDYPVETNEGFCCHPDGTGATASDGSWAKFTATETTARLDTCSTIDFHATDSLIQVFRALDPSSEEAACGSLVPIACNDQGDCQDGQASVCLHDLTVGETYYVLLAGKTSSTSGRYRLRITSPAAAPCPEPGTAPTCPAGSVEWIDPPNGVVDARQPHDLHDAGAPRGIDRLVVEAPVGTDADCWTVCDDTRANAVVSVVPHADCTSTLHMQQPMTPSAVTRVLYEGNGDMASFTAHPGNVNADGLTDAGDIISLIDALNQAQEPPWLWYSCDIDHSGACDPADIIGVIDLLNGAGAFAPWFDTELPSPVGGCP